jgi:hypothetical protein
MDRLTLELEEVRKLVIVRKQKKITKKLNPNLIETWVRLFVRCDDCQATFLACNSYLNFKTYSIIFIDCPDKVVQQKLNKVWEH